MLRQIRLKGKKVFHDAVYSPDITPVYPYTTKCGLHFSGPEIEHMVYSRRQNPRCKNCERANGT